MEPVGHVQVDGDYRESWQPQAMSLAAKAKAREIAGKITEALGGRGETSLNMTSSPLMNNSTPKIPCDSYRPCHLADDEP